MRRPKCHVNPAQGRPYAETQRGHLCWPLGGEIPKDTQRWQLPCKAHNYLKPSFSIWIKYENNLETLVGLPSTSTSTQPSAMEQNNISLNLNFYHLNADCLIKCLLLALQIFRTFIGDRHTGASTADSTQSFPSAMTTTKTQFICKTTFVSAFFFSVRRQHRQSVHIFSLDLRVGATRVFCIMMSWHDMDIILGPKRSQRGHYGHLPSSLSLCQLRIS